MKRPSSTAPPLRSSSRPAIVSIAGAWPADGGVVTRATLAAALPRSGESGHAVDVAIARVRESLDAPGRSGR
jgi:uroporphyrinogen-III synthase